MRRFLLGLVIGTAFSALVWPLAWKVLGVNFLDSSHWIWWVAGVKAAAAITFLAVRGWRGMGLGLLCSLPIGFLIFFGVCAAHVNNS
jgi:hypothetical protein